jgi:hypothetical protein
MATEWKVEGQGTGTKIIAECPVCHSGRTFPFRGIFPFHEISGPKFNNALRFKHNLCGGLEEGIPNDIRDEYWQRAVISQM